MSFHAYQLEQVALQIRHCYSIVNARLNLQQSRDDLTVDHSHRTSRIGCVQLQRLDRERCDVDSMSQYVRYSAVYLKFNPAIAGDALATVVALPRVELS